MLMLAECCFTSTETVGLLGTGAQDVHPDIHTVPELWRIMLQPGYLYTLVTVMFVLPTHASTPCIGGYQNWSA